MYTKCTTEYMSTNSYSNGSRPTGSPVLINIPMRRRSLFYRIITRRSASRSAVP